MSRYAIFTNHFSIDNSEPWLIDDLVNQLYKNNNEVWVFNFDYKGKCKKGYTERDEGYHIFSYPLKNISNKKGLSRWFNLIIGYLGMYAYYLPIIFKTKFDNTICLTMFSIFFGLNKIVRLRNYKKVKSIAIIWDFCPVHLIEIGTITNKLIGKLVYLTEHFELSGYDDICCMTSKSVDFFDNYYPKLAYKNKKVIYLWREILDDIPIHDQDIIKFHPEKKYLVFGGQLTKGRGLEFLVEVANKYQHMLPNVEFIVIGEGELMGMLEDSVSKYKLTNFHLAGRVDRRTYLSLLSKTHIGLVITQSGVSIPSFPSKTIDYMQMNMPILACVESSTDYGEIIQNDIRCGMYSIEGDEIEFVNNIKKLVSDDSMRDQMGQQGNKFLHEKMSVSYVADIISQ